MVDLVTIHHEGAGSPSDDVDRFSSGGYSYGIGKTTFKRFRPPIDNWATKDFNHKDLTICLSGNRMTFEVTTNDLKLIHAAFMDSFNRGEVTNNPLVRPHRFSPGSNTECPGDKTIDVWPQIILACSNTISVTPPITKETGAMDIVRTRTGKGYYIVSADGGVFTHGDARFFGSMGGKVLAAPIVDIAIRPQDDGYIIVGSDGGVFAFGGAKFLGGMSDKMIAAPITGCEYSASGNGYWLLAKDGGVFSFGDATFYGSDAGKVKYP